MHTHLSPIHLMALAYTLDIEGFDSNAALRQCGIESIDALREDGEWMPVEIFDRLMAAVLDITGDASFGLVAGKSIALMRYGPFVPVVLPSPNLRTIFADLRHFARLVLDQSELELVDTHPNARVVIRPVTHGGLSQHFRMEMIATSGMQMLRLAGASNADVYRVEFPYSLPSPDHVSRYVATFGPHVSFGSHECAIHFNPALLDFQMAMHDPVAYMAARTRAESALAARLAQSNMAEQVRQWLLSAFPRQPTTAETAEHLKLSERSLRRHLAMLDVTHADLAQECQLMMAERLLADGKVSLKQVADTLGFSSASSFHRAFRRWTGQTPSDWRASHTRPGN